METPDLNLLASLDALLRHCSVTGAAAELHTSAPAMSRTLAKLRRLFDDPLLVRAGRALVPTPRAQELRAEVSAAVETGRRIFAPPERFVPGSIVRAFSVNMGDALMAETASRIVTDLRAQEPGVTLRFQADGVEGSGALRDGTVDLEIGVIEHVEIEVLSELLVRSRMLGVVRSDHPLSSRPVTTRDFAEADHVVVSRHGSTWGPVDDRLAELNLTRRVVVVVPTYAASMYLARDNNIVALLPAHLAEGWTAALGLRTFEIPLPLPPVLIGMAWHPRNDADPVHRWLRERVRTVLAGVA